MEWIVQFIHTWKSWWSVMASATFVKFTQNFEEIFPNLGEICSNLEEIYLLRFWCSLKFWKFYSKFLGIYENNSKN